MIVEMYRYKQHLLSQGFGPCVYPATALGCTFRVHDTMTSLVFHIYVSATATLNRCKLEAPYLHFDLCVS